MVALASLVAEDRLSIDPGADAEELERQLLEIDGIGNWTSSYIRMRALGDPDAFAPTDLGLRRALTRLGRSHDHVGLTEMAQRWRPWRAYAMCHLWSVSGPSKQSPSSRTYTKRKGADAA